MRAVRTCLWRLLLLLQCLHLLTVCFSATKNNHEPNYLSVGLYFDPTSLQYAFEISLDQADIEHVPSSGQLVVDTMSKYTWVASEICRLVSIMEGKLVTPVQGGKDLKQCPNSLTAFHPNKTEPSDPFVLAYSDGKARGEPARAVMSFKNVDPERGTTPVSLLSVYMMESSLQYKEGRNGRVGLAPDAFFATDLGGKPSARAFVGKPSIDDRLQFSLQFGFQENGKKAPRITFGASPMPAQSEKNTTPDRPLWVFNVGKVSIYHKKESVPDPPQKKAFLEHEEEKKDLQDTGQTEASETEQNEEARMLRDTEAKRPTYYRLSKVFPHSEELLSWGDALIDSSSPWIFYPFSDEFETLNARPLSKLGPVDTGLGNSMRGLTPEARVEDRDRLNVNVLRMLDKLSSPKFRRKETKNCQTTTMAAWVQANPIAGESGEHNYAPHERVTCDCDGIPLWDNLWRWNLGSEDGDTEWGRLVFKISDKEFDLGPSEYFFRSVGPSFVFA
uniref:Peptidase A1 domain-containing protein n=1 Tax=Chromera velia CCMP2878 TaxID=1169474 RepID=A0A0G4ICK7_9ALVE|eukprot:Cvel_2287.t1-p1 / transcript=Cvel_2287.t1 / gene=Cvel_2287 / organism=Chromera_velia_CCMP2878 / gene_product=hypothetical protein / transcript_product=hypothetical protein / location=Cvel_scaffold88:110503-112005(-) / protein_length=501 / sequence_SO=supercontig / SO=protein_coding / is_pseudo=false